MANTEGVPDSYARPYDPARPVVRVDEGRKRPIGGVREPPALRPGSPAKRGYEHERAGMANPFMAVEPLAGWRQAGVTERKTVVDFGRFLRLPSGGPHRDAECIVPVCDDPDTHTPSCLYEAFGPEEARRPALRFEWHYTPKRGSWLGVAECGPSVVARQCLGRRIPDIETLEREAAARERARNGAAVRVDRQFTTADSRVELKRLHPTVQLQ